MNVFLNVEIIIKVLLYSLVHLHIIVTTLSNDTSNEMKKQNCIALLTNVIAFVIRIVITIEKFIALLRNVIAFVITKVK